MRPAPRHLEGEGEAERQPGSPSARPLGVHSPFECHQHLETQLHSKHRGVWGRLPFGRRAVNWLINSVACFISVFIYADKLSTCSACGLFGGHAMGQRTAHRTKRSHVCLHTPARRDTQDAKRKSDRTASAVSAHRFSQQHLSAGLPAVTVSVT